MASSSNSSLRLLSAYDSSGSESEDEVPASRVSVKRTVDKDNCLSTSKKRQAVEIKKRLPPPSAIANLFLKESSVDSPKDDPNDHGGRTRAFAHERGNWASYVYISVERCTSLESFIDVVFTTCDPSYNLQRSENLHISLTKTVVLKHHWIDPFSSSVQKISKVFSRFPLCLGEVKVYSNEDRSRTFIGIVVTAGQEKLIKISEKLDEALADFKLPSFYEEASFHISIAWCVGDVQEAISSQIPRLQSVLDMFIHSQPLQWNILVDKIYFRCGNKHFVFHLS